MSRRPIGLPKSSKVISYCWMSGARRTGPALSITTSLGRDLLARRPAIVNDRSSKSYAARDHINASGFGQYFIHRTGHSIGTEVHANGANMDNLEVHDERQILPNSCFSIEPGLYFPEFGIRSEINMLVRERLAEVTGKIQNEIVII